MSPEHYGISDHRPLFFFNKKTIKYYNDVIMGAIASQITSLATVYSTVYSGAYQRKLQSSASLAFLLGIHRGRVNSPHKWPVTRKLFPFYDVIMSPNKWAFDSGIHRWPVMQKAFHCLDVIMFKLDSTGITRIPCKLYCICSSVRINISYAIGGEYGRE